LYRRSGTLSADIRNLHGFGEDTVDFDAMQAPSGTRREDVRFGAAPSNRSFRTISDFPPIIQRGGRAQGRLEE
jgi:hypothetical protein